MAAIQEWFGVYTVLFRYIDRLGLPEAEAFHSFLGRQLHIQLGSPGQADALATLEAFFCRVVDADGGKAETQRTQNHLKIALAPCPDRLYFSQTPYDTHKGDSRYCECCAAVYRALAQSMECDLDVLPPEGEGLSCSLCFTLADAGVRPTTQTLQAAGGQTRKAMKCGADK